ncbi:MAG: hypothetical protein CM15mP48_1650 [Candidatus Poseidoniales archaeon]|nr:MAG: hypothetical protein CM15mP48_1650 [Candidatus Poseidoniales archaeon]
MASSAMIFLLSQAMDTGHKDCNLAQTSSLISKFSVPLNELRQLF